MTMCHFQEVYVVECGVLGEQIQTRHKKTRRDPGARMKRVSVKIPTHSNTQLLSLIRVFLDLFHHLVFLSACRPWELKTPENQPKPHLQRREPSSWKKKVSHQCCFKRRWDASRFVCFLTFGCKMNCLLKVKHFFYWSCLHFNSTGVFKMVPVEDSSAETDSAAICAPAQVSMRKVDSPEF